MRITISIHDPQLIARVEELKAHGQNVSRWFEDAGKSKVKRDVGNDTLLALLERLDTKLDTIKANGVTVQASAETEAPTLNHLLDFGV